MSRKIGITEVMQTVGDENIRFQSLQTSCARINGNEISFRTDSDKARQLAHAIALGQKPDYVGLVVWIPRNKMPKELQ